MRMFLTWLMVFGMLAGLNARVLAADAGHLTVCPDSSESCCHDDPGSDAPAAPLHDGETHCPQDHHHHLCCYLHALPLAAEDEPGCRLADPTSSLTGVRHESTLMPDGPFLSSEKPPLI